MSASTPGTYSINYTIPSSCSTASSKSISITPSNTIDFSYPSNIICLTEGIVSPTLINGGTVGGTFYSDPPGLYIDRNNGSIVTASSTVDDYDVYYLRGTPAPNAINWTTIGDIKAKAGSSGSIPIQNNFGISVRLNAAGNVLITNAINSDNNADNAGEMKAYFNNGGTWERIGHNIGGESNQPLLTNNKNTAHIAVNDAGDIIAMSNPQSDSGCSDCGRVIVLKRKNGIWSQLGSEIHGENANVGKKFFGLSIALNSAGNVLAIGDEKDKEAGANKGIVHIYEFNGTDWVRKGATGKINPSGGTDPTPNWGWSVDLDSSGNTVVIGSRSHKNNRGRFAVYEYNGTDWIRKGDSKSPGPGNYSGYDVSINAEGNMILVGLPYFNGQRGSVNAYKYNPITNKWDWWHTPNKSKEVLSDPHKKNYKSALQEFTQSKGFSVPT